MERKLRIGFLTPYYPPKVIGGMEISLWNIAEELASQGHTVRVFTLRYGQTESAVDGENPRVFRFAWPSDRRMWPTRNPLAYRKLARLIVQTGEQLDLLDAYSIFPPGVMASRMMGVPAVISVRDAAVVDRGALKPKYDSALSYVLKRWRRASYRPSELAFSLYGLYLRASDRRAIAAADLVTFQSQALRQLLEGVYRRAVVIRSMQNRDLPAGDPPIIPGIDFRRDRVVTYAGRLGEGKGVGILLQAAEVLLSRGVTGIKFLFLGSGPLETKIRQTQFPEQIILGGKLPSEQALRVVRASAVAAIPSIIFENYPRMAVDSIALGTPVVGTTAGGIAEAIGEAGIIVPAGDVELLADAIVRAGLDDGFRATLRSKLKEQNVLHTPKVVAERLLQGYVRILR